jgi:2,4-dienoyl-CoA reductase-like NADH-dependent reductase (Old Yellow Enzyme family)
MCQYCCGPDGLPTDWHLAHLVSRAVGGAALTITEATAVTPEGRISPGDLGIWSDAHVGPHTRLAAAIAAVGSVPGIQIAHAGRKASRLPAWQTGPAEPSWTCLAPSAEAFGDFAVPHAMTEAEIGSTIAAFATATRRAVQAGYRFIEIHAAHGYLMHQFLSPIANRRTDAYGGNLDNRMRFPLEVFSAVRDAFPTERPVWARVSATDWIDGSGWDIETTIAFANELKARGCAAIHVSSGGVSPAQKIPLAPGYQVGLAAQIKAAVGLPTIAVGLITEPAQAEAIVADGQADAVALARAMLYEPRWPWHAAAALGAQVQAPPQYWRSQPREFKELFAGFKFGAR